MDARLQNNSEQQFIKGGTFLDNYRAPSNGRLDHWVLLLSVKSRGQFVSNLLTVAPTTEPSQQLVVPSINTKTFTSTHISTITKATSNTPPCDVLDRFIVKPNYRLRNRKVYKIKTVTVGTEL